MKKKILSVILSLAILLTVFGAASFTASAAATPLSGLSYADANEVFEIYRCSDGVTLRIVNGMSIYELNTRSGGMTTRYTFPEPEAYAATASGTLYGVDHGARAYVDQDKGLLYLARSKYRFANQDTMAITIYVYDLAACRLKATYETAGAELLSVGAGPDGTILIGTRENNLGSKYGVILLDSTGKEIGRIMDSEDSPIAPIDSFEGYRADGTFYFILRNVTESAYGYKNNMGCIGVGTIKGDDVTMNSAGLTVKNISFANYGNPVGWLSDERMIASNGMVVNFSDFTYTTIDRSFSQDGSYDYTNHNGANAFLSGDKLYALTGDKLITAFDYATLVQKEMYLADSNIFTLCEVKDGVFVIYKTDDAFSCEMIPYDSFSEIAETAFNLNEQSVYTRTKEDIVKAYTEAVPADYSAQFYETQGSYKAPYQEYTITAETRDNALRFSNYIRWLAGMTGFTAAEDEKWVRAAKGALLSQVNVSLTYRLNHYPDKPADMDEAFYQEGYAATSSSNLASAYFLDQNGVTNAVRMFMNDRNYTMPGHRNTFLTRNGDRLAIGYAPAAAAQTILYTGSANPSGTATYNNEAAYAWPAPGYFPTEEIETYAYWTITLNTDKVALGKHEPAITVTDLDTGEVFEHSNADIGYTPYWGTTLSFAPPAADSYEGKRYEVRLTGVFDSMGLPASVVYTVNFFSCEGEWVLDGTPCTVDDLGRLTVKEEPTAEAPTTAAPTTEEPTTAAPATEPATEPQRLLGDVNGDGVVDISDATLIQMHAADIASLTDAQLAVADVNFDNVVDVADATYIQMYAAELISEFKKAL